MPINEWDNDVYTGFFKHLTETLLKDAHCSWGYVPNPSGGFMGLWWGDILNSDELNTIGLTESLVDELYIQIENDIITIKYTVDEKQSPDMEAVSEMRWKLYEYFRAYLGEEFKKKSFRQGMHMTIGYIQYDEQNYASLIMKMRDALLSLKNNNFLSAK